MKRRLFIEAMGAVGAGILIAPGCVTSIEKKSKLEELFKDGDTVCFIGDSITHHGQWHTFVSEYISTRLPDRKIRYVNCGISGDTAKGVLKRFDFDIAPEKPSLAVIMLGMNDCPRWYYGKENLTEDEIKIKEQAYLDYTFNIETIINRLLAIGCSRIILVKPSPYDQTVKMDKENLFGVNDALVKYGESLEGLAAQYNTELVDLNGPITKISIEQQQIDPGFSFCPNDRIHPQELGNRLMAYVFLKSLDAPQYISSVSINSQNKQIGEIIGADVYDLDCESNKVNFFVKEKGLPYPLEEEDKDILRYAPFNDDINRQILKVSGLDEGQWTLKIDGIKIGEYSSSDLSEGINLASSNETPQFYQALKVHKAIMEYAERNVMYRDLVMINMMLDDRNLKERDEIENFFKEFPENEGSFARDFFARLFSRYFQIFDNLDTIKAEMKELVDKIDQINKPLTHGYQLTKL